MHCLVLGSAAGGGFPQWNCACALCARARAGDPHVKPRSQVGMAVSADGSDWLLIGASPDLRQQILDTPELAPRGTGRHSPIIGVVLTSADVDGIAGLLVLREQQRLRVYAAKPILDILGQNTLFGVMDPALVDRVELLPDVAIDVGGGLSLTVLEMPGKVPLYQEDRSAAGAQAGPTYAAKLNSRASCAIIASACAELTDAVAARLAGAQVLFFDGTVFTDDEMAVAGVGSKTGRRMGHMPISGDGGSLDRLAKLPGRRVYFHINNTNPLLDDRSPQRALVEAAGLEVAFDGMRITV